MKLIIIGGGKFGIKALEFARNKKSRTILIDKDPRCNAIQMVNKQYMDIKDLILDLDKLRKGKIFFLAQEKLNLFNLIKVFKPDYVIPVVPIHFMAMLISSILMDYGQILIPNSFITKKFLNEIDSNLVFDSNLKAGIVLLSYAKKGEICPENCSGPEKFCPNFNREKPRTITQHLKNLFSSGLIEINIEVSKRIIIIINSKQLKSGLGGLKGSDLHEIFSELEDVGELLEKNVLEIIVATTCNCHGVINFFKTIKKAQ
ncbi:MAG: hypothetical protein ACFFAS_06665 [Promethearchaeota archaeon]